MSPQRLIAPGLLAVLLAGCAVGPVYHRAAAPLADHYQGQVGLRQGANAQPTNLAAWWNGFDDALLAKYVRAALDQNLDLAQAAARMTQARAGLGAANAALLPSGTVTSSAARARQSVETPLGEVLNATPGYDRWGNAFDANVSASWEIDVFGGLRRGREAALGEYQASQAGAVATRLAVAAQTADIYIQIRGLQARLDIARRQVATRTDLLNKVRLLFQKGVAPEFQMHQSEGELAQVEASVPVLQAGLDAAMNALDVMLGTPASSHREELMSFSPIPTPPRLEAMGSPADLLQRRPDLIAAERHVAAANARIGGAMAEYYPHFSLGALLGSATSVGGGNLFKSGANQASAVFGLRWRLFDFGRIDAQIQSAKGGEAESLAAYRLAALHAGEDVENAFSELVNRQRQAEVLTNGESSLSKARTSSYLAYQHGIGSLIDVLHADETLLQTSDTRAQAQTALARSVVAAYKALGGGWDPSAEPVGTATAQRNAYASIQPAS